jgi:hypothetical protein
MPVQRRGGQRMSDDTESLTLGPAKHGKLGALHCGVTREGVVVVAGEQKQIADGQEVIMDRTRVPVSRKGEEYTFTRQAA